MKNNKISYQEKLRDPRWQKMRLLIMERDEWACQQCFDSESTLHVHHKFYERGNEPWEYETDALVTLCADCHQQETDTLPEYEALILQQLKRLFFADDLREIAWGMSTAKASHAASRYRATALAQFFADPKGEALLFDRYMQRIRQRRQGGSDALV